VIKNENKSDQVYCICELVDIFRLFSNTLWASLCEVLHPKLFHNLLRNP